MNVSFNNEVLSWLNHFEATLLSWFELHEEFKLVIILTVEALKEYVSIADYLQPLYLSILYAIGREKLAEPGGFEVSQAWCLLSWLREEPNLLLCEVDAELFRRLGNLRDRLAKQSDFLFVFYLEAHFVKINLPKIWSVNALNIQVFN